MAVAGDPQALGQLLRSRRERLAPADVGLRADGRRRTAGLRREEVALLANLSTTYYTFLPAQPGRAPPAVRGQADVGWGQPLAPRPEQLSQRPRVSGSHHATKPTHVITSKTLLWLPVTLPGRLET